MSLIKKNPSICYDKLRRLIWVTQKLWLEMLVIAKENLELNNVGVSEVELVFYVSWINSIILVWNLESHTKGGKNHWWLLPQDVNCDSQYKLAEL